METNKLLSLLSKTFDDMPVGLGIFHIPNPKNNKDVRYVFMNKVVLYEMRKEKEDVLNKRIIDVAPEAYDHEGGLFVINTYCKIAEKGGSANLGLVEYSNHLVAGTYECSVHFICDNYVYVMLRNVSELEKTKSQLQEKNEELNHFIYTISHDLKEPLNTIGSYTKLIENRYGKSFDENLNKIFKYVKDASSRMKVLISDLFEYQVIGKEKILEKVDCNNLLESIKEDLYSKIEETKGEIIVEDLPVIEGYQIELRLLFQNLLSNALKFKKSDTNPLVTVSVINGQDWVFKIADNGIGIPEKKFNTIFEIFKRLHSSKAYEGSGIGLANCKKIAELHNGRIWAESKEGEGSTFYVSIPKKIV